MKSLSRTEFDRMWRVVDQSLTSHSVLRDRYRSRERWVLITIVGLSIAATAIAFVSGGTAVRLGSLLVTWASASGTLTAAIFFITLAGLILEWGRKSWAHEHAVHRLAELKATLRSLSPDGDVVSTGRLDVQELYERTMSSIPEIPDRQFLPLKALHNRKVLVSQLIDTHRGAPLPYLWLLAAINGMRGSSKAQSRTDGEGTVEQPPL